MHFVCCIKQVPDTAEVKIDPQTNTLIRSGVESIPNPYDMVALETAVTLKERHSGRITAVSMGPPQADAVLRAAVAQGADHAVLLSDRSFAGADTLATTYTLYRAVETLGRDDPVELVFCGKQAIDGDTAQTGPGLATRLGFSQLTYVVEIQRLDRDKGFIQVRRKVENGHEVIRAPLPALLTVELEAATPRCADLPALISSLRMNIPLWSAQDIGAEKDRVGLKGSPTWVRRIFAPPLKTGGPRFDGRQDVSIAVKDGLDTLLADERFSAGLHRRWES